MKSKTFKVNEIFYSVQAEGSNAGRPAVFVRFAGCNLKCPFCDTEHEPFVEMTQEQIEKAVDMLDPSPVTGARAIVVFTGGEPTLQLGAIEDPNGMCWGRYRCMETNGIIPAPTWIEWVTISPKTELSETQLRRADELKFLFGMFPNEYIINTGELAKFWGTPCFMQPLADKNGHFKVSPVLDFIKRNPYWRLSLQFHKLLNIR